MDNRQEQRDEIRRKIRELQRGLTEIDLQDKTPSDWNTEREEQLEKEIKRLWLELDKLSTNQDLKEPMKDRKSILMLKYRSTQ